MNESCLHLNLLHTVVCVSHKESQVFIRYWAFAGLASHCQKTDSGTNEVFSIFKVLQIFIPKLVPACLKACWHNDYHRPTGFLCLQIWRKLWTVLIFLHLLYKFHFLDKISKIRFAVVRNHRDCDEKRQENKSLVPNFLNDLMLSTQFLHTFLYVR